MTILSQQSRQLLSKGAFGQRRWRTATQGRPYGGGAVLPEVENGGRTQFAPTSVRYYPFYLGAGPIRTEWDHKGGALLTAASLSSNRVIGRSPIPLRGGGRDMIKICILPFAFSAPAGYNYPYRNRRRHRVLARGMQMDDKSFILMWIVYAIIQYVAIIGIVILAVYMVRKGKFKEWKQQRKLKREEKQNNKEN